MWFGLALLVAGLFIGFADRLAEYGLVNQVYYLVLVAVNLAAAGSLFGTLHSRARYRGEAKWGKWEMSGPVVVFALGMLAGMWFAPGSGSFGVTAFVEGPNGPLRQGRVILDFGADRRVEAIGEKGAAFFAGIPANFRGQEVAASLEAEGFEREESGRVKLAGDSVYIRVRRRAIRLHGIVLDEQAEPIATGNVEFDGLSIPIKNGRFDSLVPGDLVKSETVTVDIRAPGFVSQTHQLVPHSQEFRTKLTRKTSK